MNLNILDRNKTYYYAYYFYINVYLNLLYNIYDFDN